MADLNEQARELAEVLEQVNEDMRRFGKLTDETSRALSAGSFRRAKELEQAGAKTGDALGSLAKAGMDAGRAMLEGKKGAAAFNQSLDGLAQAATMAGAALTFLIPGGPLIKGVIAGITAVTTATLKYAQAANEMADKLYKGYSDLAKSGAVASDGLTGVFEDAKKLGLSMNELGDFVNIVGANSKDMALFGAGVADSRKRLASMGKALEGNRESFIKMGYNMSDVTETMVMYMKQQRVAGDLNNRTAADLAAGARAYLLEQDALTKITGMAVKEQEQAREQIRSQERFAAKLEELRQQGRAKEAKALEDTYLVLYSQNKQAAQGFADISTNNVQTEAAQKSLMGTQGESMRVAQQISAGQIEAAEGAQRVAKAHGETATRLGATMGQIGTYNTTMGDLAGDLRLRGLAEQDVQKVLAQVEADRKKQGAEGGKAADAMLDAQGRLRNEQIKANEATERFIAAGIVPATNAMTLLAKTTTAGVDSLNKLFGIDPESKAKEAETQAKIAENNKELAKLAPELKATREAYDKAMEGATLGQRMGIGRTEEQKKALEAMRAAEAKEFALKRSSASASTAGGQTGGELTGMEGGGGSESAEPAGASAGGPTGAPSEPDVAASGPGRKPSIEDYITFTSGTGSLEHFTKLHPNVAKSFLRMARDYNQVTGGKKLQVNSAYRSPEEQAAVNPGTNPKAAPGMSLHQHGRAIDIQSDQVESLKRLGILGHYGFKTLQGDPPHIYMRDGGVIPATPGGVDVKAGEAGKDEAFVPLPDGKAIPVTIDLKNAGPIMADDIGRGVRAKDDQEIRFAGVSTHGAIDMGPLSTDRKLTDMIMERLGLEDVRSKRMINLSGIATNYNIGGADFGSAIAGGAAREDITARVASLVEEGIPLQGALQQTLKEFQAAMQELIKSQGGATEGEGMMKLMYDLVELQRQQNATSRQMLQVAAN